VSGVVGQVLDPDADAAAVSFAELVLTPTPRRAAASGPVACWTSSSTQQALVGYAVSDDLAAA
jgi:hypothetical protein